MLEDIAEAQRHYSGNHVTLLTFYHNIIFHDRAGARISLKGNQEFLPGMGENPQKQAYKNDYMVVLSRPARLSRALDTKNNCLNPAIDQANISSATLARTSSIVCTDDQRSCYFFPSKAASKLEQVKNQSICVPLWKCPSSRTPTNLPSCQNELKGQNPPNPSIAAP